MLLQIHVDVAVPGYPRLNVANSVEGVCPTEEGQGLVGTVL